ncbi:TM0106 family RecB-like putative nuclease [bacterium]|nr:TM0106 family RecB-like putative nuclease [bacterium]
MSQTSITASMLYDLVHCPHRVWLDLYGDAAKRDPVSAFVQMLWEMGTLHERDVIDGTGEAYTDLSGLSGTAKEAATMEAMRRGDDLIYSGRIGADDLVGIPDLLRKEGTGYTAGDIKSGTALEGGSDPEDGRPKMHYAMQLALYTDILERLGLCAGRTPFIWDAAGNEVRYDLDAQRGVRNTETWWDLYTQNLQTARSITAQTGETLPAYSGTCKQCHWVSFCKHQVISSGDLTMVYRLGRSSRDHMKPHIPTIHHLAACDLSRYIRGTKTVFPRIGPPSLKKFQARARLLAESGARPVLTAPVDFPQVETELYYDVETDPFEDICYLHGFVERIGGNPDKERYIAFVADEPTPEAEEKAFRDTWAYIQASRPCAIYFYSKYERTTLKKLAEKFPEVASVEAVEALFKDEMTIDLLEVVEKKTEWPCLDRSIKTLATYLGFAWRDENPSGAASIEWYHSWVESGDDAVKQRILEYNEDDCVAMRVLLEKIKDIDLQ